MAVGDIVKWADEIKAEYGVEVNFGLFMALKDISEIIQTDDYFIWGTITKDQLNVPYLSVIAWGIKKGSRSVGMIREVQERIILLAKDKKVGYIIQGSHIKGNLNRVLCHYGYTPAAMRREVDG